MKKFISILLILISLISTFAIIIYINDYSSKVSGWIDFEIKSQERGVEMGTTYGRWKPADYIQFYNFLSIVISLPIFFIGNLLYKRSAKLKKVGKILKIAGLIIFTEVLLITIILYTTLLPKFGDYYKLLGY